MNQLINMLSSCSYGSAGKTSVPIVIRAVIGRGWGQGYQHSKALQGMFAQIPGLKVIMPTTPYDMKGLLTTAIRDNNPVLVLEHRWLYWQTGEIDSDEYTIEFGVPAIIKSGSDFTVVATSWMNVEAIQAANILSRRGVKVEVIDVRSISPFNEDLIVDSVNKTGHCLVADNDWLNCGFSAEISSRVYDKCWKSLRAPIRRIGFAPVPCPTTRPLETAFYPNAETIVREIEKILGLSPTDLTDENFFSHENRFMGPF
jgi:pyruvate dehydrogenase E1 component beta subunit